VEQLWAPVWEQQQEENEQQRLVPQRAQVVHIFTRDIADVRRGTKT